MKGYQSRFFALGVLIVAVAVSACGRQTRTKGALSTHTADMRSSLLSSETGGLAFNYSTGTPSCENGRTDDSPFGITIDNVGTTTIENLEFELYIGGEAANVTSKGSLGIAPGARGFVIAFVNCTWVRRVQPTRPHGRSRSSSIASR